MKQIDKSCSLEESCIRPVQVANFFLRKAEEEEKEITQLKLLKLVYIAYGWTAALLDKKLFDEPILAWKHGPVVASVYHEFKHFGSKPISEMGVSLDLDSSELTTPLIPQEEKNIIIVLDIVWGVYKKFSAWSLRNKTHEENTPWSETYQLDCSDLAIDHNLIKEHFITKIKSYLSTDVKK
jgi:uncharacterized phage-associated protein